MWNKDHPENEDHFLLFKSSGIFCICLSPLLEGQKTHNEVTHPMDNVPSNDRSITLVKDLNFHTEAMQAIKYYFIAVSSS